MDAGAEKLAPSLRTLIELDLQRMVDEGHLPALGEREVRFRLKGDGRIAWFEATRIRAPSSELERRERASEWKRARQAARELAELGQASASSG